MLHELHVHWVRNLHAVSLELARCNVFVGDNGSGKTSLLEAVFLLSRGKSFRHHEPKRYISHQQQACTIWAKTDQNTLAIQKQLDEKAFATTTLKFDGNVVPTQSKLSFALPTLLIEPSGMMVLDTGSTQRRQLLDWLVFHMKPEFYGEWLSYQRLLRQRNALLKSATLYQHQQELMAWDYQLAHHATLLHTHRQAVFDRWQTNFEQMVQTLLPNCADGLSLVYQAGFDEKVGLFEILQSRLLSDKELGYTRLGGHRADVLVMLRLGDKKEHATNVLSRGEKKLLITALKLSQLHTLCQTCPNVRPVVLIDDIDAELDGWALEVLLQTLASLPCQVFMSSLSNRHFCRINELFHNVQWFAVRQGKITPMTHTHQA